MSDRPQPGSEALLGGVDEPLESSSTSSRQLAAWCGCRRGCRGAGVRNVSSRNVSNGRTLLHFEVVEVATGAGVDRDDLLLDAQRRELGLLQQFDEAVATVELRLDTLSSSEPNAANASSSRNWARSIFIEPATADIALICADDPTRRHRDTHVHRRADAGVEEVEVEEDLAVGDRDHVGRDVGRHVAGLRLDDRQRGQRTAARCRRTAWRPAPADGCGGRTRRRGMPRGPAGGAAAATSGGTPRPAWTGRRRR